MFYVCFSFRFSLLLPVIGNYQVCAEVKLRIYPMFSDEFVQSLSFFGRKMLLEILLRHQGACLAYDLLLCQKMFAGRFQSAFWASVVEDHIALQVHCSLM